MCNYYINLIGLRVILQTPFEITVTDRLKPFLCEDFIGSDCIITLTLCENLPEMGDSAICHGLTFYDYSEKLLRIFHCGSDNKIST